MLSAFAEELSSHQLSPDFGFSGLTVYSPLTLIWWRLPFGIFVVAVSCDEIIVAQHWSVARSATETGAKPALGSKSLVKGSCVALGLMSGLQGSKPVERFRQAFGHIYR